MIRTTFVMEQHLGHQTYYQNLQRFVEQERLIEANWVPVTYHEPQALWERIPLLPPNIRGSLSGRAQVRRGLADSASDVIFFNTQVPAMLGGTLTGRRPYLVATDITPRQYDQLSAGYGHRPDRPGLLKNYKHRVNVSVLRRATRLLPWSTWTRDSLIQDYGVDPQRIEVIPPGVDLNRWTPGPISTNRPLQILFVGGDLHRKGGGTLLKAFRMLPPGAAELHLVTRTTIAQEEGVQLYHNMQPNSPALLALYQSADVFVLPSEAEAFGIAAVEAAAAGLAAIVTPIGGLTDIVIEGENGFFVQPGDVAALSDRLARLAHDPSLRLRMGTSARAHAERHFDARRNAERTVQYLMEAVPNKAQPHSYALLDK